MLYISFFQLLHFRCFDFDVLGLKLFAQYCPQKKKSIFQKNTSNQN